MSKKTWLMCVCSLVLSGVCGTARADEASVTLQLRRLVAGVIEYSQWPQMKAPLLVCVAGHDALARSLREHPLRSRHGELSIRRVPIADTGNLDECEVLYVGNLSDAYAENLLKPLVGKPVVTIRQNPTHCSEISFFCIYLYAMPAAFEVNLDLVARSGVRLNPWVLTLAQPDAQQQQP
ncbi:MAG: YfiR family protein [Comamonadaceae bacterium]|nr:YfiR family protein [Comamonadaceae bacterium]